MQVKIGFAHSQRELAFRSNQTPTEVEDLVTNALREAGSVLSLTDDVGRTIVLSSGKVAYVEIDAADMRRVGFGHQETT